MDFGFTEEQNDIRATVQRFCKKRLTKEYVRWMDENVDFPPDDLWKEMADLGFIGIAVPEEYGGVGYGQIECCIILEELAKASCAVAIALPIEPRPMKPISFVFIIGTPSIRRRCGEYEKYYPLCSTGLQMANKNRYPKAEDT